MQGSLPFSREKRRPAARAGTLSEAEAKMTRFEDELRAEDARCGAQQQRCRLLGMLNSCKPPLVAVPNPALLPQNMFVQGPQVPSAAISSLRLSPAYSNCISR